MPRQDHELSVPELLAKIERLFGYVRAKTYAKGFEDGRTFERGDDETRAEGSVSISKNRELRDLITENSGEIIAKIKEETEESK